MLGLKLTLFCFTLHFLHAALARNTESNLLPGKSVCGRYEQKRIFGGVESELGEFPWMALIESKNGFYSDFICGGSLINSRYVLTAAHCIKDTIVSVRLGEHNIATKEDCRTENYGAPYCADPPLDIEIESVIVNEYSDIALIRLKKEVAYTDFISPVCLPIFPELNGNTFDNTNVVVAGWGKTENKWSSDVKLIVEVPVVPVNECANTWRKYNVFVSNSQICAGKEAGKSSCNGDSGGPLMYLHKTSQTENWIAVGVVSFGLTKCATENVPAVYTRVSDFIPWILENISV